MNADACLRRAASYIVNVKDGLKGIQRTKEEFLDLLSKSKEEVHDHSFSKLKQILDHAYRTTAYYRKTFDDIDFNPSDLTSNKDISMLPVLNREVLEENSSDLISNRYAPESLIRSYTGGTSGTHLSFYRDRECQVIRRGRQQGLLELCGYYPGDRCGLIWGAHADLDNRVRWLHVKGRFRRFASGMETLCCTVLTEEILGAFYRRLVRFTPRVLYGYPNAMSHFAEFVEANRLPSIHVETIICTAERLTEQQRRKLTEIFGGEVFNIYGTREHGFIAFECRRHQGFHVDTGNVFLEILENGKPVEVGQPGDIVITDLHNHGMPFIRNRIGDRARLSTGPCDCGNPLPLLESLDGRITDAVYRPDGSRVDGCMLVDLFIDVKPIRMMQIVQKKPEGIELNLVVTGDYNKMVEERAVREVRQYMGPKAEISINIVPDIPRNPSSGKYQEVICHMGPPAHCQATPMPANRR